MGHKVQQQVPRCSCYIDVHLNCVYLKPPALATSKDIPIQTIIKPPPKLSLVTKLHCAYHSPGRLYTITCPSDLYRQNLDSSKAKTLRQSCSTQLTCSNAKFKRALRRAAVNLDPVAGLLGCI
jgi:hypothetical protein